MRTEASLGGRRVRPIIVGSRARRAAPEAVAPSGGELATRRSYHSVPLSSELVSGPVCIRRLTGNRPRRFFRPLV